MAMFRLLAAVSLVPGTVIAGWVCTEKNTGANNMGNGTTHIATNTIDNISSRVGYEMDTANSSADYEAFDYGFTDEFAAYKKIKHVMYFYVISGEAKNW